MPITSISAPISNALPAKIPATTPSVTHVWVVGVVNASKLIILFAPLNFNVAEYHKRHTYKARRNHGNGEARKRLVRFVAVKLFAQAAHNNHNQRKADACKQRVQQRPADVHCKCRAHARYNIAERGYAVEHLRYAQNRAVGCDKRQIHAHAVVKRGGDFSYNHFQHLHKRRDNEYEEDYPKELEVPYFRAVCVMGNHNIVINGIGDKRCKHHYYGNRNAHADCRGGLFGNAQKRADSVGFNGYKVVCEYRG